MRPREVRAGRGPGSPCPPARSAPRAPRPARPRARRRTTAHELARSSGANALGSARPAAGTSVRRRPPTAPTFSRARRSASTASDGSPPASTSRCSTRPVFVMSTTSSRPAAERHQLDVPHGRPGQRRVLHHRDLVGQLGEQPHRAVDDVVEVDGAVEQAGDRLPLGRRQRLDRASAGRRTAGTPCRSGSGRRWCAAGRSAPPPRGRPCRCGSSPARRPRWCRSTSAFDPTGSRVCDVVLDDRAQHGEPAVLGHRPTSSALRRTLLLALETIECQFTAYPGLSAPHGGRAPAGARSRPRRGAPGARGGSRPRP